MPLLEKGEKAVEDSQESQNRVNLCTQLKTNYETLFDCQTYKRVLDGPVSELTQLVEASMKIPRRGELIIKNNKVTSKASPAREGIGKSNSDSRHSIGPNKGSSFSP